MPSVGWLTKDNMWLNLITRRSHVHVQAMSKMRFWNFQLGVHQKPGTEQRGKKEITYDFRNSPELTFLNINCGNGHKFLGTIISVDLTWTPNTSAVTRKTQQRLYCTSTESVLTCCITAWYRGCTEVEGSRIQQIINTAQKIVGRENSQWAIS